MNAPTRSRRDFLAAAAHVAGGSTLLWALPPTRLLAKDRPRVLVLGAGLAGLRCALLLEASGCEVTNARGPRPAGRPAAHALRRARPARSGRFRHRPILPADARDRRQGRREARDARHGARAQDRRLQGVPRPGQGARPSWWTGVADRLARRIISLAIQRYAGQHTFESTTASIALPAGDDIKGRIIGREGRNIRAFEAATGVTVLIDDTPGSVLVSGFDPVRREVAKESMLRLLADGRIHPTRIEEVVHAVKLEMEQNIIKLGEDAVAKAGLPPLAQDIVKLLGRLHFRHSFSQNLLEHSIEVAHLMGLMAAELGLDVAAAKRAGLLHE